MTNLQVDDEMWFVHRLLKMTMIAMIAYDPGVAVVMMMEIGKHCM